MQFRSAPKFRSKQSKYLPHQNTRECGRRIRQIITGQLDVPEETRAEVLQYAYPQNDEVTVIEIPEVGQS